MCFLNIILISSSEFWGAVPLVGISVPILSTSIFINAWSLTVLAALFFAILNDNKNFAGAQSFSSGSSVTRTSIVYFWFSQILDRIKVDWRLSTLYSSRNVETGKADWADSPRYLSFWNKKAASSRQTTGQWVFALFMVILFSNFFGLVPFTEAITGKTGVTLGLSVGIWAAVTIAGIIKQKSRFPQLFLPSVPQSYMAPVFILLESVSYCFRAISLGVRLWANMLSGHTLLHLISGMALVPALCLPIMIGAPVTLLTTGLLAVLTGLEALVCVLQSGVFCLLASFYLTEVLTKKEPLAARSLTS